MGNNFCVCQGLKGKENESNIFAGMPINNNNNNTTNKPEEKPEKETINTTFSKYYTNNRNDTISIYNGGQSNCNENSIMNNTNTLNTFRNYENNINFIPNRSLAEINKNDPYNKSSGKFNVLIMKDQIENGSNLQENKENDKQSNISSNFNEKSFGEKNKQASISNFSMNNFCFEVKNTTNNENISNKNNDNEINNKDNVINNTEEENNIYLSKSSSNKDYLNNDSNYYNSNKREENRDNNLSLYDEDSES